MSAECSAGNIPPGYKQTEVGAIPDDWNIQPLGSLADVTMGQSPVGSSYNKSGIGLPLINGPTEFTKKYPVKVQWTSEPTKTCRKDDLLLCVRGSSTGRTNVSNDEYCIGRGIAAIRAKSSSNTAYLTYQIHLGIEELLTLSAGSTFPNVDGKSIRSIQIPIPPTKAEQVAIAEALSDTDAFIESLEQLISKKRQIKQGAMQELLTGKRRLPGFEIKQGYKQTEVGVIPEDWRTPTLESLTVLMTNGFVGTATTHYASNDNGILYIQGYNVEENSFNFHGIKFVTEDFHSTHMKSCLRGGDLLTVQTGDVGLTTVVPESLAGSNCHALIISRFDQKQVFSTFISYYLNSKPGRSRLKLIEIGTTMKHLNVGDMLQFTVPLPPTKAEQEAIASILSDMDSEITALEEKLAKARQIKQGMMQELLTGKIRLI